VKRLLSMKNIFDQLMVDKDANCGNALASSWNVVEMMERAAQNSFRLVDTGDVDELQVLTGRIHDIKLDSSITMDHFKDDINDFLSALKNGRRAGETIPSLIFYQEEEDPGETVE